MGSSPIIRSGRTSRPRPATGKEGATAETTDPLERRKDALHRYLETKVAQGFRIESQTDTQAIIVRVGGRRSLFGGLRKRGAGERHVASVDEHGEVTLRAAEPIRY